MAMRTDPRQIGSRRPSGSAIRGRTRSCASGWMEAVVAITYRTNTRGSVGLRSLVARDRAGPGAVGDRARLHAGGSRRAGDRAGDGARLHAGGSRRAGDRVGKPSPTRGDPLPASLGPRQLARAWAVPAPSPGRARLAGRTAPTSDTNGMKIPTKPSSGLPLRIAKAARINSVATASAGVVIEPPRSRWTKPDRVAVSSRKWAGSSRWSVNNVGRVSCYVGNPIVARRAGLPRTRRGARLSSPGLPNAVRAECAAARGVSPVRRRRISAGRTGRC
jgi:hypothetical protein